jgi:hypothetical protein
MRSLIAFLIQYLTDEECEQMACILYFVRQKTVRPYDEVDDLAASIAFSKLPSIDCPAPSAI